MDYKIWKVNLFGMIFSIILIVIDQITKLLAVNFLMNKSAFVLWEGVFELRYLQNYGAAFGIMQNKLNVFIPMTILMCVIFVYFYIILPRNAKFKPLRVLLCFFFAGAVGNFIDRLVHGYVVDFFYFRLINFPIFNVADIYITCSCFVFVFLMLFYYKDEDLDEVRLFKKKG